MDESFHGSDYGAEADNYQFSDAGSAMPADYGAGSGPMSVGRSPRSSSVPGGGASPEQRRREDARPFHQRETVGGAKYHPTTEQSQQTRVSGLMSSPRKEMSRREAAHSFKTEKWRERGVGRWPNHAAHEVKSSPTQFTKEEEVVPLQRTLVNPQKDVNGEMWTRSLRTRGLGIGVIGMHNENLANAAVSVMFDGAGNGFSGRTRVGPSQKLKRELEYGPHTKNWVERPVAVGKHALAHMEGSRYQLNLSARDVVPKSMAHGSGAMTAR